PGKQLQQQLVHLGESFRRLLQGLRGKRIAFQDEFGLAFPSERLWRNSGHRAARNPNSAVFLVFVGKYVTSSFVAQFDDRLPSIKSERNAPRLTQSRGSQDSRLHPKATSSNSLSYLACRPVIAAQWKHQKEWPPDLDRRPGAQPSSPWRCCSISA